MNVAQIRDIDVANGEGIRTSLFVSGCKHNCYNCFNQEYQSYEYGEKLNKEHILQLQKNLEASFCKGLSILGGEPLDFPTELLQLITSLKFREGQDIWVWTGYSFEEILLNRDKLNFVKEIDILVDGLYVEKLKDLSLRFRGSSNQRIINVKKTLEKQRIILLP